MQLDVILVVFLQLCESTIEGFKPLDWGERLSQGHLFMFTTMDVQAMRCNFMTCVDHAHAFKARLSGKEQTASCRLEPNSLSPCLSSSCFAAVLCSAPMVLLRCQCCGKKTNIASIILPTLLSTSIRNAVGTRASIFYERRGSVDTAASLPSNSSVTDHFHAHTYQHPSWPDLNLDQVYWNM